MNSGMALNVKMRPAVHRSFCSKSSPARKVTICVYWWVVVTWRYVTSFEASVAWQVDEIKRRVYQHLPDSPSEWNESDEVSVIEFIQETSHETFFVGQMRQVFTSIDRSQNALQSVFWFREDQTSRLTANSRKLRESAPSFHFSLAFSASSGQTVNYIDFNLKDLRWRIQRAIERYPTHWILDENNPLKRLFSSGPVLCFAPVRSTTWSSPDRLFSATSSKPQLTRYSRRTTSIRQCTAARHLSSIFRANSTPSCSHWPS